MENLNKNNIEAFEKVIDLSIQPLIYNYSNFITNDMETFINYYKEANTLMDVSVFNKFKEIKEQISFLFEKVEERREKLNKYEFWVLLEWLEVMRVKIDTIDNCAKWYRSSKRDLKFSPTCKEVVLKQNQSVESLLFDIGEEDYFNEANFLSISNQLEEEMYTSQGGNSLKIEENIIDKSYFLKAVVDVMVDENILGKDLKKKIGFINDDLETLEPKETFIQSVQILIELKKGDNLEFKNSGLGVKNIFEGNSASFSYPSIIRQLGEVIDTDDTISNFSVNSIKKEQDAIFVELTINSILNDEEEFSAVI